MLLDLRLSVFPLSCRSLKWLGVYHYGSLFRVLRMDVSVSPIEEHSIAQHQQTSSHVEKSLEFDLVAWLGLHCIGLMYVLIVCDGSLWIFVLHSEEVSGRGNGVWFLIQLDSWALPGSDPRHNVYPLFLGLGSH